MLCLKRLLTSFVLFVAFWIPFFIGTLAVAGGAAGVWAAAGDPDYQSGYAPEHAAVEQIGRKYGPTILLIACGVSVVIPSALAGRSGRSIP
jgi:hypothetical protein